MSETVRKLALGFQQLGYSRSQIERMLLDRGIEEVTARRVLSDGSFDEWIGESGGLTKNDSKAVTLVLVGWIGIIIPIILFIAMVVISEGRSGILFLGLIVLGIAQLARAPRLTRAGWRYLTRRLFIVILIATVAVSLGVCVHLYRSSPEPSLNPLDLIKSPRSQLLATHRKALDRDPLPGFGFDKKMNSDARVVGYYSGDSHSSCLRQCIAQVECKGYAFNVQFRFCHLYGGKLVAEPAPGYFSDVVR